MALRAPVSTYDAEPVKVASVASAAAGDDRSSEAVTARTTWAGSGCAAVLALVLTADTAVGVAAEADGE